MIVWDHWHIEPSSICTLRCPRCPRSEVPESLLNRQLSLAFFQQRLGEETVRHIRKITFCGNDGDPIYCRDLVDICAWLKSVNPALQLVIVTNGGHRPVQWWQGLAQVLDHSDQVHWSIDGWDQASNEQYRVNSDWESTMQGIQAFTDANHVTYRLWATIAFRFNQFQLEQIKSVAQNMNMDAWQLTKSTKFGSHYPDIYGADDPLCPESKDLVSGTHRFERVCTDFTQRSRPGRELKEIFWQRAVRLREQGTQSGICFIGNKGVFLNSQGHFYPCCWTANRYAHNSQWNDLARNRFNLWSRTFADIMADPFWHDEYEFLTFDSLECSTKCTQDRLKDREHVTEW